MSAVRLEGGERVGVQHTLTERISSFAMTISAVGKDQRWHFGTFPAAIIDLSTVSKPWVYALASMASKALAT